MPSLATAAPKRLTILSVSYPLAPVTADPVGGAEQVLAHLDRALVAAGDRSIVIAPAGSSVAGELWPLSPVRGEIDAATRAAVQDEVARLIKEVVRCERPDVLHFHGIDFEAYLPSDGPPALVTLHLPLDWYHPAALRPKRADVCLHPVSRSQARSAPPGARLHTPIENGVDLDWIVAKKRSFVLALGRICPEKGFDDALDAARQAGFPLLLAGSVFPYPEHQHHLQTRILPRLDRSRRWIGPVAGRQKRRLMAQAMCVLVPSKARETSSLVAMEAMAAGTPVIAYASGALPEIVEHGRTGFIVRHAAEMAAALARIDRIDPETCRQQARERFALARMTRAYRARYAELAG